MNRGQPDCTYCGVVGRLETNYARRVLDFRYCIYYGSYEKAKGGRGTFF